MSVRESSTSLAQGFMEQLRLPMLTIPSKQGASVDLTSPLADLIRTEYGEDPTQFRAEVRELNQLRDCAIRPSRNSNGTSDIRRYFAQLSLLPTRFAAAKSNLHVTFIWADAFTEKETAEDLVQFEMSAVLFNLGALHSKLGTDLQDELRGACTHFQCSAGAFYILQTNLAANSLPPAATQTDMCPEVLAFCKNLMLAQAQECMVEKSLLEQKRPSLVSKVAWEVSTLYQKAIDLLDSQVGAQVTKKNKTWQKFLQTKFHIYQSVAYFCQALSSEEDANYGQAIAYFHVAMDSIQTGTKVSKAQLPSVKNAVKYLTDLIQVKSQSAVQANQQVYHQLIPTIPDLETIQGALLVKPIEFSISDKSVLGNDIFSKLVPMSVLEANSMYSEEKANLLRSVCASIQEKNKDLAEYLSKMNIDEVLSYKQDKVTIPDDVCKIRAEVTNEHQGRMDGMDALLESVLQMSKQIHRKLDEICMYLTRDAPEVANQIQEFQKQADKIDEYLAQGDKSNQELHQVMKELQPKLTLLTVPESTFINSLPKLDLVSLSFDEQSESRLAMLVDKIEEMQNQRSDLERRLRSEMETDDISVQLISCPESNRDSLFENAMKKHKQTSLLIRQNCEAQENIVKAMTDTNANLAGLRKELISVRNERETVYKGVMDAWKRLGSIEESLKDGMKFYQNLDKRTSKLFETIKSSLPPPPLQQPTLSDQSLPPKIAPLQPDNSYKPISPFQSLPADNSRPPVPSRRLKPNAPEDDTNNSSEVAKISSFPVVISLVDTEISSADTKISSADTKISLGDTKNKPEEIDDDELTLLNWVEVKPENTEQHKIIKPVPQTPTKDNLTDFGSLMSTNQITASVPQPNIPAVPALATQQPDISHFVQTMQNNQSELGGSLGALRAECRSINQSVSELSQNMSAVINQSNQSNAVISSLNQVTSGQTVSIEQLSSHLQTTNQNIVFTSQLVKLVETNLLTKLESVEKACQDSVSKLDQLFQHVTQKQHEILLKIEPIVDKIDQARSADSDEIQSLKSSLEEVREDLRHIRNKQDSMVLLPNQSERRVDPLSMQSRSTEAPSQVDQLWDLLDAKPADQKTPGPLQPSENTAFSPVAGGIDKSGKNRPSSAFQLSSPQLPTNQITSSHSLFPAQTPVNMSQSILGAGQTPPIIPQNPRGPSTVISQSNQSLQPLVPTTTNFPQSMVQTQLIQQPLLHAQKPLPPVSITQPTHENMPILVSGAQRFTPQHMARSVYPPQNQQIPIQPTIQPNQQISIQSNIQPNQQIPIQTIQPNQQISIQSNIQPNQQIPIQPTIQPNQQIPIQSSIQPNQQIPIQTFPMHSLQATIQPPTHTPIQPLTQPTLQPNPQIHTHPPVQPNPQIPSNLNPQQHAYLQALQKQLSSSSGSSVTPEQMVAIQKHLQSLK